MRELFIFISKQTEQYVTHKFKQKIESSASRTEFIFPVTYMLQKMTKKCKQIAKNRKNGKKSKELQENANNRKKSDPIGAVI